MLRPSCFAGLQKSHRGSDRDFSKILHGIDKDYPDTPIFVFGYSQLARGISYRSHKRVPSHMVLHLGKDRAICKLVQAAGRAAGESRAQLTADGFTHVTILMNPEDFGTLNAYPLFLEDPEKKMQAEGSTLGEAILIEFSGKYAGIFSSRPVAPEKHHAEEHDKNMLQFAPAEPDELIGRDYLDLDLAGASPRRV
jgi:hypothetical protein